MKIIMLLAPLKMETGAEAAGAVVEETEEHAKATGLL